MSNIVLPFTCTARNYRGFSSNKNKCLKKSPNQTLRSTFMKKELIIKINRYKCFQNISAIWDIF